MFFNIDDSNFAPKFFYIVMAKNKKLNEKQINQWENEMDDLRLFIKKKKNQNNALKKIIENLNTKVKTKFKK